LYFHANDLWSPPLHRRFLIERANQRALERALESCKPEVASIWQVGAMSLGLITTLVERKIPIVYAACDDWPTYAVSLDAWCRLFARRPRIGHVVRTVTGLHTRPPDLDSSGAFCFVSDATRTKSRRHSPFRFPKSTVVYSGVDFRLFPRGVDCGTQPWRWRLLYTGRLDPRKGIDTLVHSLALLPEHTMLAVHSLSSDQERARLEKLARQIGVEAKLEFHRSDRSQLSKAYSAADVLVFPSEWEEPFGLVPLEAMACGTPVVATGMGGSSEFLVDGDNCVMFEAGDPESLARAIRALADDIEMRRRLVANAFATAQFFDVDRLADVFETWHTAAAEGFRSVPTERGRPPLSASSNTNG
jgi:glycosyltransferase involved in cell wall biosynthesis